MHVCVCVVDAEFRVTNMVGDVSIVKASSMEELRVRAALHVGVLSPCIVLIKGYGDTVIEESQELLEVFGAESIQPHDVYVINKEEDVKHEATGWSAWKWINVLRPHVRFGDDRTKELAEPLKLADERYEEKMREWLQEKIRDAVRGD